MSERLTEQERTDLRWVLTHYEPEYDEGSRAYEVVERILADRLAAAEARGAQAVRERVEALHRAGRLYGPKSPPVCLGCTDDDANQNLWPCPTIAALSDPGTSSEECASCGEGDPTGECPKSKRPCGHHCNHIWESDHCDWCGFEATDENEEGSRG